MGKAHKVLSTSVLQATSSADKDRYDPRIVMNASPVASALWADEGSKRITAAVLISGMPSVVRGGSAHRAEATGGIVEMRPPIVEQLFLN